MGAKVEEEVLKERSSTELRRINKPLVEKRRRERINNCLEELKTLILDATKRETCRYSKLEKADILEMTVRHLRNVERHRLSVSSDSLIMNKYRSGFAECANEVTRYLGKVPGLSTEIRARMFSHLTSCLQAADSNSVNHGPGTSGQSTLPHSVRPVATALPTVPGYSASIVTATPVFAIQNPNLVIGFKNNESQDRSLQPQCRLVTSRCKNNGIQLESKEEQSLDFSATNIHHSYAVHQNNATQQNYGQSVKKSYQNQTMSLIPSTNTVPSSQLDKSAPRHADINGNFASMIGSVDCYSEISKQPSDNASRDVWRPW